MLDWLIKSAGIRRLARLNGLLANTLDRHHTIGHAFFMRPGFNRRDLLRVWTRQVYPLIEEFLFDQPERLAEFKLETFWPDEG